MSQWCLPRSTTSRQKFGVSYTHLYRHPPTSLSNDLGRARYSQTYTSGQDWSLTRFPGTNSTLRHDHILILRRAKQLYRLAIPPMSFLTYQPLGNLGVNRL